MEVRERDPVSGRETTGHEWNGIKELDTPVPRGVLMFLIVTHLWAIAWWFFVPAWPLGTTLHEGLSWRRPEADGRGARRRGQRDSRRLDDAASRPKPTTRSSPTKPDADRAQQQDGSCSATTAPPATGATARAGPTILT